MTTLLGWGLWAFGIGVAAGLLLHATVGDDVFLGRYTGYVMPWLLAGLAPGAVWAWWRGQRALGAVLGLAAIAIVAEHAPRLALRPTPVVPPGAHRLTVMTFNTWSRNADAARIAGLVAREAPDLVLIQEMRPWVFREFAEALRAPRGPYPHVAWDADLGQAVLSRFPLEPKPPLKELGRAQKVLVHAPGGPIVVLNVHPLRSYGWWYRYRQISTLVERHVVPERAPLLLGGDFNANEHTELYRVVTRHLTNAHDAAGSGFGFTWPAHPFLGFSLPGLVRIDHLFFSDHFVALRARTLDDSAGSDHRPVVAELALRRAAEDGRAPRASPGRTESHRVELRGVQAIRDE